jgi:hypothetical protein
MMIPPLVGVLFALALLLVSPPVGAEPDQTALQLHDAIEKVCPITGVSVGNLDDRLTWVFHPTPEATPEQIQAAQHIIDIWNPTSKTAAEQKPAEKPPQKKKREHKKGPE